MLQFLPHFILGPFIFLLFLLNTLFWCTFLYLVTFFKIIIPLAGWRSGCTTVIEKIATIWAHGNSQFIQLIGTQWEVNLPADLQRNSVYLASCNHQSWTDIVAIMHALDGRVPFYKFFLKEQLKWVPMLGVAWWALDFPFMKRYSKEYLEKHPEKRGQDMETTRKACERYRNRSLTILNFMEGTRFTASKHAQQNSPYQHLLKPKSGGVGFVFSVMGNQIQHFLDITITYPQGVEEFWGLVSGKLRKVVVDVEMIEVPTWLKEGNYLQDDDFRQKVQAWVNELWVKKDALIAMRLQQHAA